MIPQSPRPDLSAKSTWQLIEKSLEQPRSISNIAVAGTILQGGVVYYEVVVRSQYVQWKVLRRFAEFDALHSSLCARMGDHANLLPPFPTKHWKWLINHLDPHFAINRQAILNNYLYKVLSMPNLYRSPAFLSFLRPSLDTLPDFQQSRRNSVVGGGEEEQQSENVIQNNKKQDGSNQGSEEEKENEEERASSMRVGEEIRRVDGIFEPRASDAPPTLERKILPQHLSAVISKVPLACPEVTSVDISHAQVLQNDHVVYQVNLENSRKQGDYSKWTVLKRFAHFHDLDSRLRASLQQANPSLLASLPPLPPRHSKWLYNHLHPDFIERRRIMLNVYLQSMLSIAEVASHPDLLRFIGV